MSILENSWNARLTVFCFAVVASVICSRVAAADKSGVSPNSISLPKGPGSIEGLGDSFQPTLNTGTARYSIGLKVPPGTAGHHPAITLIYEGGGGNGPLGFGWQLPIASIQRQTDKGIPTYGQDVGFPRVDRFVNDMKEELVPQSSGFFFCENESAFIRYARIGDHWEGTLPNGTRLQYGLDPSARVHDGTNITRAFSWLLQRETDTQGNTITYSYASLPGNENLNQTYLLEIRYGPGAPPWDNFHFVRFIYETRSDWFEDCRPGFPVRTGKRLKSLIIGTQAPVVPGHVGGDFNEDGQSDYLARKYQLEYVPYAGTNSHWSLLASVRMIGADGLSSLPPASFGYSFCNPPDIISGATNVIGSSNEPDFVMDNDLVDFADLNGDALPDVLKTGGPAHQGYLNQGERYTANQRVISWADPVEVAAPDGDAWLFSLSSSNAHLADMNGDGLADFVNRGGDNVFYFANAGRVSWGDRQPMSVGFEPLPSPFGEADVRTADIDFDKHIDLIRGDGLQYHVWFNTGSNRYSERIMVPQNQPFDFSFATVQIADLNGDRVPDLARIRPTTIDLKAGLGYGRFQPLVTITNQDFGFDEEQVGRARLTDITADGLADLVIERAIQGELWYWINLGNYSFSRRKRVTGLPSNLGLNAAVRWADLNGNGSSDLIYADGQSSPKLRTLDVGEVLNCGATPNLLLTISNGIGRVTHIGYLPSTHFALQDAAAGKPWPDVMPFPVQVVASVTNLDSLGHQYVSQFRYHDGYYDSVEKQFRGFARVEQIELGDASAATLVTRSHFDTGRDAEAMKGKLLRLSSETADGGVFTDERTAWITPPRMLMAGTNGQTVNYAHPVGSTNIISELGQGTLRRLESQMAFDDFGNQTLDADYGIAEGANRSAFDDERFIVTEFALNTNAWIIRNPKRQEIRDEHGAVVSRTDFFYDDETFSGNNFGQVTLGNLTMKHEWLAPSNSSVFISSARTKYDTYGNPTHVLDALADAPGGAVNFNRGHVRKVEYDSLFHAYPVTETIYVGNGSAPLVVTARFDEGFGTLLSASDFNNQVTRFSYDAFARLTKIIKPGDTALFSTVEYDYFLAQPVPDGGTVNFIETRLLDKDPSSPSDPYFISRQFTDGLGRALMTKTEAEPEGEGDAPRVAVKGAVVFNARQKPFRLLNPYFSALGGTLEEQLAFENIEASGWTGQFHEDGQMVALSLSAAQTTITTYDATLRELTATNPDGTQRRNAYEPLIKKSHDENDTDAASPHFGTPLVHHEDGLGRLVQVDEIVRLNDDGTVAATLTAWTTRYQYDLNDQLTRITDSQENVKAFEYDGLKRKTFMNDPDRGIMRFFYDDAGNLTKTIDAKTQEITYAYDGGNRILAEDYRDGATNNADVAYFYDTALAGLPQGDNTSATARHTKGRLAYVRDLSGEEHTSYDERGREEWVLKRVRDPLHSGLVDFRTGFRYDSLDRVTRITYPDNDAIDYAYNSRNLSQTISGSVAGPIITAIDYLPSEQQRQIRHGNTNITIYAYDSRLRLNKLRTRHSLSASGGEGQGEVDLLHFAYDFDPASNIRTILDQRSASAVPAGDPRRNSQTFQYDSLYRLTTAKYSRNIGVPDQLAGSISYRYDRIGNLLAQTSDIQHHEHGLSVTQLGDMSYGGTAGKSGRIGRAASDPPGPHALTAVSQLSNNDPQPRIYPYDPNGNMTQIDGLACTWDFKDRLIAVENSEMRAQYTYDYTDRRITKRVVPKPSELASLHLRPSVRDQGPSTVLYPGKHFEVREHEAPVKYIWNGQTRVARVTRTLSTQSNRVQRLRLTKGWNLCSVAVAASLSEISNLQSEILESYLWDPLSESWLPLSANDSLTAGSVLWLKCAADTTLSLSGAIADPSNIQLPPGRHFLPLTTLEPLELTLGIPPPTPVWRYASEHQRWQTGLPPSLTNAPNLPRFLPVGETVFIHLSEQVSVEQSQAPLSIRFYHQDHLGSSSAISDSTGALVEETANYPFGSARNEFRLKHTREPYAFSQKERDAESRLHYFEARFLATASARFLSVDSLLGNPPPKILDFPQALNGYSYVLNSPLNLQDPTGKETVGELIDRKGTEAAGGGNLAKTAGWAVLSAAWTVFGAEGVSKVTDTVISGRNDLTKADMASAALELVGVIPLAKVAKYLGIAQKGGSKAATIAAKSADEVAHAGKAALVQANRAVGLAAEKRAAQELIAEGNKILGSHVSARTSKGLRVIDHLVQTPTGQILAVEVKSGGAVRGAKQLAKDAAMASEGAVLVGKNAPAELTGKLLPPIETVVRRY